MELGEVRSGSYWVFKYFLCVAKFGKGYIKVFFFSFFWHSVIHMGKGNLLMARTCPCSPERNEYFWGLDPNKISQSRLFNEEEGSYMYVCIHQLSPPAGIIPPTLETQFASIHQNKHTMEDMRFKCQFLNFYSYSFFDPLNSGGFFSYSVGCLALVSWFSWLCNWRIKKEKKKLIVSKRYSDFDNDRNIKIKREKKRKMRGTLVCRKPTHWPMCVCVCVWYLFVCPLRNAFQWMQPNTPVSCVSP